jgi:hypothetical protein
MIVALLVVVGWPSASLAQPAPAKPAASKPAASKPAASKPAAANPAKPPPVDGRPCIGVVSRLGESFTVKKVGIVVFQNEEHELPVEAWRIDDLVVSRITDFLKGQVAVRHISYPRGTFASLDEPQPFRNYEADFGAILRTLTTGTHCARYIVVTRGGSRLGSSNQGIDGLGIVSAGGLVSNVNLHALFVLSLYDGDSFQRLRYKVGTLGQPTFLATIRGPHREVDKSFFPESLDIARDANLRDATRELLRQGLDMTLPELKPLE